MAGRFFAILLPALALLGAVVAVAVAQDRAAAVTVFRHDGDHVVALAGEIVAREYDSVRSDLLYLAEQHVLREFLDRGGDGRRAALAAEFRLFCARKGLYDQIRLLDEDGMERVRVNHAGGAPVVVPDAELQPKAQRYYHTRAIALERGQVYVSPFDLNVEREVLERPLKPVVRLATPVFDGAGRKRGIVILNTLGARLLGKLDEVSAHFPGRLFLVNGAGHWLRGPAPEDEWGFALGHPRSLARTWPDAWAVIATAPRGHVETPAGLFTAVVPAPFAAPGHDGGPPPDDRMRIVAFTSRELLAARSDATLARLLGVAVPVALVIAVLAGFLARAGESRRTAQDRLAQSELRLRALSVQLLAAQEKERQGLSRDLHDDLGQLLTAICLDLERCAGLADSPRRAEALARALSASRRVLDRVHQICDRLRPMLLDDLGLKDAVQSYLAEYESRTGLPTHAELRFEPVPVPTAVSENLYRILQEALTNVEKYARARRVDVRVEVTPRAASLTVRDDGVGFVPDAVASRALGLLGMRERVGLLGGSFAVDTAPGRGTEVRATVPLGEATCRT